MTKAMLAKVVADDGKPSAYASPPGGESASRGQRSGLVLRTVSSGGLPRRDLPSDRLFPPRRLPYWQPAQAGKDVVATLVS